MARPREVALLLALFLLLGSLRGTRAQEWQELVRAEYEDYEDYGFEEDDYEYGDQLEDSSGDSEDGDAEGSPPTAKPQNQEFTPMCNNENCWIRVDWEPPPRDTWMSCLLGYR